MLVLSVAAIVRVGAAIAYPPALFWADSWNYLYSAFWEFPVLVIPDKPLGYPLLVRVLAGPERSLTLLTAAQHVAGLATGVIVYALLLRLRINRLLAALAVAVVVLDSYAIVLEHHVMAESLFTLALTASLYLAVLARGPEGGPVAAGASGLLLAVAITLRTVAVAAFPIWVGYLIWSRCGRRWIAVAVLAFALPLAAHSALRYSDSGRLDLMEMDGLFLYGRVGQIADCRKATVPVELRPLCPRPDIQPPRSRDPVDFFLWDPQSPPWRVFGDLFTAKSDERAFENQRMRQFALQIIRHRPLAYTKIVSADFVRFFEPGVMSILPAYDDAITFPRSPRAVAGRFDVVRGRVVPDYEPRVRAPAGALVDYQRWIHTPRWLMGAMALAGLVAVLLGLVSRGRMSLPRMRETFLLIGTGLALLFVAANWHFEPRYLVPAVPLLMAGGVLAVADLFSAARGTTMLQTHRAGRQGEHSTESPSTA